MAVPTREVRTSSDVLAPLRDPHKHAGTDLDPLEAPDSYLPDPFEDPKAELPDDTDARLDNLFFAEVQEPTLTGIETDASRLPAPQVPPKPQFGQQPQQETSRLRQGLDKVVRTLTGVGLDEIQTAIETGALPEKVSLKLFDPFGNVAEEMIRAEAARSGLPPEDVEKVTLLSSVFLGFLKPSLSGLSKAEKAAKLARLTETVTRTPGSLQRLLAGGRYAIISAENPAGRILSEAENAARTKQLMKELRRRGYTPIPARGHYGGAPENSFIVPGMSVAEALELGAKFEQQAVLTPHGIVNVATRKVNPGNTEKIDFSGAQTDNFTIVRVGGEDMKFTIPIDFNTEVPLSQAIVEKAGGKFVGETEHGVWFNEPKSGSTLLLPIKDVSEEGIESALLKKQAEFGLLKERVVRAKLPTTMHVIRLAKKGKAGATWYHGVPEELRANFGDDWELVADLLALASPGLPVGQSIRVAMDAYTMFKAGKTPDEVAAALRIGGPTGPTIRRLVRERLFGKAIEDIVTGEDSLKVPSYARALKGDRNAVVVDRWLGRIFYPEETAAARQAFEAGKRRSPDITLKATRYRLIESWIAETAPKHGLDPRDLSAMLWFAAKVVEGDTGGLEPMRDLLRREIARRPELAKQVDFPGLDDAGRVHLAILLTLGRAAVGAVSGAVTGDTLEERLQNALLGAGVGAAASPALVKRMATVARQMWNAATPAARAALSGQTPPGTVDTAGAVNVGLGTGRIPIRKLDITADVDPRAAVGHVVRAGVRRFEVDWNEMTDPSAVDRAVNHLVRHADEFLTERTGESPSVQVMDDIAAALGVPKESLLGNPRMAQREKEIRATVLLADAAMDRASELALSLSVAADDAAREVLKAELRQHLARAGMVYERLFQMREEMGLGLRAFVGHPQETLRGAGQVAQLIRAMDAGLLPIERVADHLSALTEPAQQATYMRKLFEAGERAVGMMNDIYMASLLSTFQGSAANVISNALAMESAVAKHLMAAALSSLRGRPAEEAVLATEAMGMLVAQLESWRAALKAAVTTFKTGRAPFGELGEKAALTTTEELAEMMKAQGPWGYAMDWYAKLISAPRRFIGAQDAFFKVMNKQMAIYAEAYREAAIQQSKGLLRPEDRKALIRRLIENPPEAVAAKAEAFADKQTFNQALHGRLASLQNGMSHPFVKFFVPFFRTPVNIFRYNFEFLPGLGLLVKEQREAFLAGGRSRDLVMAQWAMGTMAIGTAALLAYTGRLRGRGPSSPELRRDWKKEGPDYSVNIGTEDNPEWIGIQRLGVLAPLFGTVADLATVAGELSADEMAEIATAMVVAFSRNWLSQTYTQGAHDVLEAIMTESPDEVRPKLFQKIAASMVVPSGVRQLSTGGIPGIFEGDRVHREVYSVLDEIISRTPWRSYLYPHVGLDGREVQLHPMLGPDFLSPIPIGRGEQADNVSREILRLRLKIGLPSSAIEGPKPPALGDTTVDYGIPLDAEQQYRYRKLAGNSLKLRGSIIRQAFPDADVSPNAKLGMWDALTAIVQTERYKALTDAGKRRLIRNVVDRYRQAAESVLVFGIPEDAKDFLSVDNPEWAHGDPDLRQKFLEKKLDRAEALAGPEMRQTLQPMLESVIQSLGR